MAQMSQGNGLKVVDARWLLVERVSASSYFNRSARLRDLLQYLTKRILEEEGCEIREHEVGYRVFGRPPDYDTTADNIVRVHASMLRKRLDQFFTAEGADEPLVIEIPKGNYAPVFHERAIVQVELIAPVEVVTPVLPRQVPMHAVPLVETGPSRRLLWTLAGFAILFAVSTLWLLTAGRTARVPEASRPAVQRFWSQVFPASRPTDIVLDDSAVALYQELTGRPISLSEYFDRSYLRGLGDSKPAGKRDDGMDAATASTLILRRQSSFSSTSFYWKLTQMPEAAHWHTVLRFARDYSFRELKGNNSVLLGNGRTNPWVQPFEGRLGLRWHYDKDKSTYYPVDTWDQMRSYGSGEGYGSIARLPNLGGTGNVLIVSATGGSAMNAAADFLADNTSMSSLEAELGSGRPYFEALIRMTGRSALPRDAAIVFCRPLRGDSAK
jgi:hypothetical protein